MAASGKSLQEKFQYALDMVKSLPKPSPSDPVQFSNDDKLQMYALFKQADQGPCCTNRPGMFDVVGRYKWDAWKALGDISKEEAMQRYLDTMISVRAPRAPTRFPALLQAWQLTVLRDSVRSVAACQAVSGICQSAGVSSGY